MCDEEVETKELTILDLKNFISSIEDAVDDLGRSNVLKVNIEYSVLSVVNGFEEYKLNKDWVE